MPRKKQGEAMQMCGVRMPAALLARIDAYGEQLKTDHPGLSIERGDVIRELVHRGLDVVSGRTGLHQDQKVSHVEALYEPGEGPAGDFVLTTQDLQDQTAHLEDLERTTLPGPALPPETRGADHLPLAEELEDSQDPGERTIKDRAYPLGQEG